VFLQRNGYALFTELKRKILILWGKKDSVTSNSVVCTHWIKTWH